MNNALFGDMLIDFVKNNDHAEVHKMIDAGFDVNYSDRNVQTALHLCVKHNNKKLLTYLIGKGALPDKVDAKGRTSLHLATSKGNKEIVELLLPKSNINSQDENYDTPLMLAVTGEYPSIVKLLVQNPDCDVNLANKDKTSPLMRATHLKHSGLVNLLLNSGRLNIDQTDRRGQTALHKAASKNCLSIVILLMERNASTKLADNDGKLPYDLATDAGVKQQLQSGSATRYDAKTASTAVLYSSISLKPSTAPPVPSAPVSPEKRVAPPAPTPGPTSHTESTHKAPVSAAEVFAAIVNNKIALITELLEDGLIDFHSIIPENRDTPLLYAVRKKSFEIAKLFIDQGADIAATDLMKRNIFHLLPVYGTKNPTEEILKLSKHHASLPAALNAQDNGLDTPVLVAIKNNNVDIVKLYCGCGECDLNIGCKDGTTALIRATMLKAASLVNAILDSNRVNIDQTDAKGQTALHKAAEMKLSGIAKILVTRGARKGILDNNGALPFDVAKDPVTKELVTLTATDVVVSAAENAKPPPTLAPPLLRGIGVCEDDRDDRNGSSESLSDKLVSVSISSPGGKKSDTAGVERAFIHAIVDDNVEVVRSMLSSKPAVVEISKEYEDGENALLYACRKKSYQVAKLLIEAGADTLAANKKNRNCLHYLAKDATKTARDLLHQLVSGEAITIINDIDDNGDTPLLCAIKEINVNTVKELASHEKCDVDREDQVSMTPLMCCAELKHAGMIGILMETNRVDYNKVDKDGKTALHIAVINEALHIVILLKTAGASPYIEDSSGKLPKDYTTDRAIIEELNAELGTKSEEATEENCALKEDESSSKAVAFLLAPESENDSFSPAARQDITHAPSITLPCEGLDPTSSSQFKSLIAGDSNSSLRADIQLEDFNPDLSNIPTVIPDKFDADTFERYMKQGKNRENFPPDIYESLKDVDGYISRDQLLESSINTDVFLTHDWGIDELHRNNHLRVLRVNEALKKLGIITWFDKDRMDGEVIQKMCDGIERTKLVITFITQRYLQKVNSRAGNDNCRFEFLYALRRRTSENLVAVVMEDRCAVAEKWIGPVGMALGGSIFINYVSDENFEATVMEIYNIILKRITPSFAVNNRSNIIRANPGITRNPSLFYANNPPSTRNLTPPGEHNFLTRSRTISNISGSTPRDTTIRDSIGGGFGKEGDDADEDGMGYQSNAGEGSNLSYAQYYGRSQSVRFQNTYPPQSNEQYQQSQQPKTPLQRYNSLNSTLTTTLGGTTSSGGFGFTAIMSTRAGNVEKFVPTDSTIIDELHEKSLVSLTVDEVAQLFLHLLGNNFITQQILPIIYQENVNGELLKEIEKEEDLIELNILPPKTEVPSPTSPITSSGSSTPNSPSCYYLPAAKRKYLINRLFLFKGCQKVFTRSPTERSATNPLQSLTVEEIHALIMKVIGQNSASGNDMTYVIYEENISGECLTFAENEREIEELLRLTPSDSTSSAAFPFPTPPTVTLPNAKKRLLLKKLSFYKENGVPIGDLMSIQDSGQRQRGYSRQVSFLPTQNEGSNVDDSFSVNEGRDQSINQLPQSLAEEFNQCDRSDHQDYL